ncbi:ATP-binding protein [Sphingomonas sp.]|uniref:sensor histidine kinase n=1 Tax=Sphingomonas sp. TaxID=28214 RepID=UPI001AFDC61D|nr:ATP-binding protein [Sphingomonas sp.]MBO9712853.1 GHKL domain-containing protein [Sphingomonas sp.]
MASAMAHELSQPLTAASNYLETSIAAVRRCVEALEDLAGTLESAARQNNRSIDLVRRMRNFVVSGAVQTRAEPLAPMISTAWTTIGAGSDVALELDLQPDAAAVLADRIHIETVLTNLLRNAVQAMDGAAEKRIRVATWREDEMVFVRVADSGPGVAAEIADRLFEPLFTTQPRGSGLGLPISRTIVEAHGGALWLETPVAERGADFVFALPGAQD